MSEDTKKGWGGSRVRSGRKKKGVVVSSAATHIQDTGMCSRISTSSASSSVQSNTVQAGHTVNNVAHTAGATGFFAPRVSQQPQAVGYPAPPSTVPVRPPSTSAAIVQLNKDLADAAFDSPATGELTFDESLGDEEGEEGDSVNAEVARKETEEAEPKVLSENHQWLKTTLAQIVKDTTSQLKMPRCYKDGHFWVHPVDPVFALKRAALLPRVFTFSQYLLILNGYNENPIARQVSTLSGPDYFLLTNRYLCSPHRGNDKGCGKSYQGSDPWIIRQLPEYVQRAFPACLSARGSLDTAELDVMKATFAGHFGADPFSKTVRELKVLHHDRLETMYYCAALHFGFRGPNNVFQFLKFEDPLGYAGYAPSRQYFKSMFTAWFSVHRTFIDRVMSSLPATIIKADHTYKSISAAWSMPSAAFIDSASIINLSHVAKVKGAVSDANGPLPTLAGTVIKKSLSNFSYLSASEWSIDVKEDGVKKLAEEVDCISLIYETLMKLDSVGLPLQPSQVCAGQLVTLVIGKAPLAEGELVAHDGTWPSPSGGGSMKVTPAYTVIKLINVLPGYVVAKHSQTLKWLMDNGGHAIVQIRTLRSRSLTSPHPSDYDPLPRHLRITHPDHRRYLCTTQSSQIRRHILVDGPDTGGKGQRM
ncbi:hypothetical protein B0H14DRAFT_3525378 [Mycena olivaceomarginata]|nr:hypothetical protein B0H14DRAFT_3525378 [Mycena olivaceomarginata]